MEWVTEFVCLDCLKKRENVVLFAPRRSNVPESEPPEIDLNNCSFDAKEYIPLLYWTQEEMSAADKCEECGNLKQPVRTNKKCPE